MVSDIDPLRGLPVKLLINTWLAIALWRGLAFAGFKVGPKLYPRMPGRPATSRLHCMRILISFHDLPEILDVPIQIHSLMLPDARSSSTTNPNPLHVVYTIVFQIYQCYTTQGREGRVEGRLESVRNTTLNLHQVFLLTKAYLVFSRNFESTVWHNLIVHINDYNFLL